MYPDHYGGPRPVHPPGPGLRHPGRRRSDFEDLVGTFPSPDTAKSDSDQVYYPLFYDGSRAWTIPSLRPRDPRTPSFPFPTPHSCSLLSPRSSFRPRPLSPVLYPQWSVFPGTDKGFEEEKDVNEVEVDEDEELVKEEDPLLLQL